MTMPNRCRFTFNDGSAADFTLDLPARPWVPHSMGVGEADVSGAGVPAYFEVRRDRKVRLELRFYEDEWPSIRRLLEHGQRAGVITWYPDVEASGTSFAVYLDEPSMGTAIEPSSTGHPKEYRISLLLRRTTGDVMEPTFWEDL